VPRRRASFRRKSSPSRVGTPEYWLVYALALSLALGSCAGVTDAQMTGMPGMSSREPATGDSVSAAMGGAMEESAHMRMTSLAPPAEGDSERAATIAATLRQALEPYRDYHRALADGYRIFAPRVPQRVYHLSSLRRGILSAVLFDPSRPTSLLYERTGDSTYRLVGAMYTAPRRASAAALNARVPLSVAQWHLHTNLCLPGRSAHGPYGTGGPDGRPLFGVRGSITTEVACTAAGGRFFPQVFGWMVHVYPFATDPAHVWDGRQGARESRSTESRK
jgi:hypothetical protein